MKVDTFKCDVCGTMKGTGNHWFLSSIECGVWIRPWLSEPIMDDAHLCSDSCVLKTVQAWLDVQKKKSEVVDAQPRI